MSADEEFGRALGDRLRQEVSDVHAGDGLADALRARKSRRSWTMRAAVGAPLVAAAAAAAVLVATAGNATVESPSSEDRRAAPPVTSTTKAQFKNVAQVQQLTIKALRSAKDYVIHEKMTMDTGYDEYWTDRATDRYRMDSHTTLAPPVEVPADGEVTLPDPSKPPTTPLHLSHSIAGDGPLGDRHHVYVDHVQRTWHTSHDTEPPPANTEVPDVLDADALKKAIDKDRMELIGTETVNGKETHHLRLFATFRGYQIDLWVDSGSYLPVRETSTVIDGGKEPVLTSDYTWLPRTEENLAKLELTPPPGYVEQ